MHPRRNSSRIAYRVGIRAVHDLFVLLTVAVLLWAPINWVYNARQASIASMRIQQEQTKWPRGQAAKEYNDAKAYNRQIAASPQTSLGEILDPFTDEGKQDNDSGSSKDTRYQALLRTESGGMGSIRIPKISMNLPIYHGTSKATLANGVGHLYGTSLPVGGGSTNAVLTGHSGIPDAVLFSRLEELRHGDVFYIQTLGRTMGYRVTGIHVVLPEDTHLYKVVPGRDLVTLMTCTPQGINTHRLIITGERGNIPDDVPKLDDGVDAKLIAMIVAAIIALLGFALVLLHNSRTLVPPPWHYDGTPVARHTVFPRSFDSRGLPPMGMIGRHSKPKRPMRGA